jgi:hypothetical protein
MGMKCTGLAIYVRKMHSFLSRATNLCCATCIELLEKVGSNMKSGIATTALGSLILALVAMAMQAQTGSGSAQENVSSGLATAAGTASATTANTYKKSSATIPDQSPAAATNLDSNPFDPLLEPPPLPKGKPTLIGGLATQVDQVRNHLTIQPFGGGPKIKVFVDERSRIYRDGTETTVLGIHKGDRVYLDTMLDGSRIFAKNVRVSTQTGMAQMRGQVLGLNRETGILTVRDPLSVQPINFTVSGGTRYSSSQGGIVGRDLQPGSLIDVQFATSRNNRPVAYDIVVLAKPGESYVFSGTVVSLDMRSNSLSLENRGDQQTYEVHFSAATLPDAHALRVGSEVTARAVFDGKQYQANNLQVENTHEQTQQPQVQ